MSAVTQDTSLITSNKSSKCKKSPFELLWIHGQNNRIPACNISTSANCNICYVSGSVVIIYDFVENKQRFLEGHINNITCRGISRDLKYLTTFDYGEKNSLLIWSLKKEKVLRSYCGFKNDDELSFLEFSCDSSFLIILKNNQQTKDNSLYIWNWIFIKQIPKLTYVFSTPHSGYHHFIATHPHNKFHFLTSSTSKVTFFKVSTKNTISTSDSELIKSYHLLELVDKFHESVFLPNNMKVISNTSNGKLLIWGCLKTFGKRKTNYIYVEPFNRIPIRLVTPSVRLTHFTTLCVYKNWLITGNSKGEVSFYNTDLTIITSYRNISKGPIKRVSFSYDMDDLKSKNLPASIVRKQDFQKLPDFVISTENGYCGWFSTQNNNLTDILSGKTQSISSMTISSLSPFMCFGDHEGTIQLWDYEKYKMIDTKVLDGKCKDIECLHLNAISTFLACGLSNGSVWILDVPALVLTPDLTFQISKNKIRLCKFSPNSEFLIFIDDEEVVILFKMSYDYDKNQSPKLKKKFFKWDLLANTRHHSLPIVDILYDNCKKDNIYRMFTLGQDRQLVVYNLTESVRHNIKILTIIEVEPNVIPQCMIWSPFPEGQNFLGIVCNDYKIKIYDLNQNRYIKMNLLPIYDSPISQLLSATSNKQDFFVFKTSQSIGLVVSPIDGNPFRSRAIQVSSVGLKQIMKDKDDKYVFSYGGYEKCINMWKINYEIMPDRIDDKDIKPFLHLIPDENNIREEIMNTAYALQIERLGNLFSVEFNIKEDEILLEDLVYVMTALGYYPSQREIDILMKEAKTLCESPRDNKKNKTLSLNNVIKLYVNHRPVKSIRCKELMNIFNSVFNLEKHEHVTADNFRQTLREMGESIDENEMIKLLIIISENEPPNVDIFHNLAIDCRIEDIYDATKEAEKKNEKLRLNKLNWEEFYAEITKKDENKLDKFTYRAMLAKLEELKFDTVFKEKTMLDILDELLPPEINENTICQLLQYKL